MTDLKHQVCVPCEEGGAPMNSEQISHYSREVPNWKVVHEEHVSKLMKEFKFPHFMEALNFANKVGRIAEQNGHHPKLVVEWGKTTIYWWTHAVGGLHKNDFIMASKTDDLN